VLYAFLLNLTAVATPPEHRNINKVSSLPSPPSLLNFSNNGVFATRPQQQHKHASYPPRHEPASSIP
jgi:hypothetical protein